MNRSEIESMKKHGLESYARLDFIPTTYGNIIIREKEISIDGSHTILSETSEWSVATLKSLVESVENRVKELNKE